MSKFFIYTQIFVTPEGIYNWVQAQEEIEGMVVDSVESPRYRGPILADPVMIRTEVSEELFKAARAALTREISI